MQHRFLALTTAILGMSLSAATPAHSSEIVWSGLVMATNAPEPTPIPAELNRFAGTLKAIFGYNQFQVIGESRKTLKSGEEDWLATSKYFSLRVDSKVANRNSYLLGLQLFQEDKLLLETEAKLNKASPLVIKGPQVGDGQLVLLLVIE